MPPYAKPIVGSDPLIAPWIFAQVCGGIWGNGTFPLPVAEEGKVPFP